MTLKKELNGTSATISVEGRLDTTTSPELEKEIQSLTEAKSLTLDLAKLNYISSAGLRVLLSAHKNFSKLEGMTIININDSIIEIFDVTGFKDILNIK